MCAQSLATSMPGVLIKIVACIHITREVDNNIYERKALLANCVNVATIALGP